jgi:two-component system, OmpR family, phosphate regulon response regulator PhoB
MDNHKILVVEDDPNILKLLSYNLKKESFVVAEASSGKKALELLKKEKFDLLILDIMLPEGMSGLDICRNIRADAGLKDTKIMMLTAKGEDVDRIVGFELGADDYVVKPFSPREVMLRIKAILRRQIPSHKQSTVTQGVIRYEDLRLDTANYEAFIKDSKIDLTIMEFKLLMNLIVNKGNVQTRDALLENVWGISSETNTRTIDTHVKKLRSKIGKYSGNIETVRSIGYRFKEK